MNVATETVTIFVIYTSTEGFVPRTELGNVSLTEARNAAAFVRDTLKCPTVRLARETVTVESDDAGMEDNDNV